MDNELLQSVDVQATCDCCHSPTAELIEQDEMRPLAGSDEMVPVRVCKKCDENVYVGEFQY